MALSQHPEKMKKGVIENWHPEDKAFWEKTGQKIASRNLWISVPCLLLSFCVWMLFSAVAVNLNKVGFNFTTDQLFMLTALFQVRYYVSLTLLLFLFLVVVVGRLLVRYF